MIKVFHSKTTVNKDYGDFSVDKEKKYQNKVKAIQEVFRRTGMSYDDFDESLTSTISSNERANRLKSYYHKLDVKLYEYKVSSGVNVEFQTRVEKYQSDIKWTEDDLRSLNVPCLSMFPRSLVTRTVEEEIAEFKKYRSLLKDVLNFYNTY